MAEQVRAYEVQIKGANSVRELKQEISALRDKLVSLDSSTDEYKETVQDLIKDERKLREVMSASKDAITGATGSYNALVNEMSALKQVWREVTDEAERSKIGERIAEINDELKRLDSSIGNNQRNVGNYEAAFKKALMTPQQELKKLKVELANLEEGTEEYNRTFQRMAQLTHDVAEQTEQLKWSSADLGDILGNLAGVAQGVSGGFSAISAVQGLIGEGNEDVEKAMLTTQRWIQLIQGLGALEELGDKVKGLWTGIKNFSKVAEESSDSLETLNESTSNASAGLSTVGTTSKSVQPNLQGVSTAAGGTTQTLNQVAGASTNASAGLTTVGASSKSATVSLGTLRTMLASVASGAKALGVALKGALVSSGIGAVIMAITYLLVEGWEALSNWWNEVDEAKKTVEDFKWELIEYNSQMKVKEKFQERDIELMKIQGASEEEIINKKIEQKRLLQDETKAMIANLEAKIKNFNLNNKTKEQYNQLQDSLKELVNQYTEYGDALSDLEFERLVILPAKKAAEEEKKRQAELEKTKQKQIEAQKKAQELYNAQQKKAEDLYKALQDYYKTDTQKLADKLKEELRIIDKWNIDIGTKTKAKQLARKKYQDEVLKENLESTSAIYSIYRENVTEEIEILGVETEKGFEKQLEELTRFKEAIEGVLFNIENGNDVAGELKWFNAFEGTDIKNLKGLELALDGVNKKIFELINTKSLEKYNNQLQSLSDEAQNAIVGVDLSLQKKASESFYGYYEGVSPSDLRKSFEERYAIQEEYLNREIELYKKASEDKTLTDQQREEYIGLYNQRIIDKENLLTEKIIEANNMQVESFRIASESIMGITESLGDIFGTVADMMMDNAEAQRDAGDITQEEYEKQFEKAKAFQTAQAIINTIAGAVGAFMGITKDTGGWGIALAIAQATAVFASGMAQVKKIQDTKPSTKSSSSDGGKFAEVTPSATADFRPELTQNATGGQETEDLANALSRNPIKAYVVESDISSAQSKAQQRTKESTF